jgi:hypothetical protein
MDAPINEQDSFPPPSPKRPLQRAGEWLESKRNSDPTGTLIRFKIAKDPRPARVRPQGLSSFGPRHFKKEGLAISAINDIDYAFSI